MRSLHWEWINNMNKISWKDPELFSLLFVGKEDTYSFFARQWDNPQEVPFPEGKEGKGCKLMSDGN